MGLDRLGPPSRSLAPIRIADPDLAKELDEWTRKAEWAHQRRNETLHSAWTTVGSDPGRLMTVRLVPGPSEPMVEIVSLEAGSLEALADVLEALIEGGKNLLERIQV